MALANKSSKRTKLLEDIVESMSSHEMFSSNVKRNEDEATIQKALFLRLEKGKSLQKILVENNIVTPEKAEYIALKKFAYEQDINTTVKQFCMFGTQHRPDAVIELDDIRIAIEIKKGNNGASIRSGIGQSILYSNQYDFTLYIFVDTTQGLEIKSAITGTKEQEIITQLWDKHNVMFRVI